MTALDKLWIHGGAIVEGDEARVGRPGWRPPYEKQRQHKQAQLGGDAALRRGAHLQDADGPPPFR